MKPVKGIQPPRFKRADLGAHIPFIQVWQRPFWFAYYLVIDGQRQKLFSKFTAWPSRHAWRHAVNLAARLDRLLEDTYQRGLNAGMRPDEKRVEPEVHVDEGAVFLLHMDRFWLRRRGKTRWLLAYEGVWTAEIRQRRSGIEIEPRGWADPLAGIAPAPSGGRALATIPPAQRAA